VVRGRETALEAGGEVLGGKTKFRLARHVIGRIGTEIETRRTGVAREGRPAGKKKALRFFQEKAYFGIILVVSSFHDEQSLDRIYKYEIYSFHY
jgi:hypothetical protein